jgi:hypothetical protein
LTGTLKDLVATGLLKQQLVTPAKWQTVKRLANLRCDVCPLGLLDTQLTWRHHKMTLTTRIILVPAVWRGNFGAAMLAAVGRM